MKIKKRRKKLTIGERIFNVILYILLAFIIIVTLYPLLYVISASISDPQAVASGKMILFPIEPSFESYRLAFEYQDIWIGYANTILYTFGGTVLQLVATLPCAYALSRKDLPGRGLLMGFFLLTMYLNGGLIPNYLNVNSFGLVNTRTYMLISGLVSVYNLIIARTFFANTISWELQEAAYLDGASTMSVFLRVVLPLSAPIIVVLGVYYAVAHWNEYFSAMIYLKDRELYPLQVFLREILTQSSVSAEAMLAGGYTTEELEAMEAMSEAADRMKYAIIVISSAPMLAVYPKLQKYFQKGTMIGSVKG